MRTRRAGPGRVWWAAALLSVVPVLALAQSPGGGQPQQQPQHQQQQQQQQQQKEQAKQGDGPSGKSVSAQERDMQQRRDQIRLMTRDCDAAMQKVGETNRWMEQHQSREQFREMGRQLEGSGAQLREMTRTMDKLCDDPELQKDQERLRDMDKLRDQLRQLLQAHDRSHQALRKFVRMP